MLGSPNPISLASFQLAELQNWSFIELYSDNHDHFVKAAQVGYQATCNLINSTKARFRRRKKRPTQSQCCSQCFDMVMISNVFKNKAEQRFGPAETHRHEHAAELLARYILDRDWAAIDQGCP